MEGNALDTILAMIDRMDRAELEALNLLIDIAESHLSDQEDAEEPAQEEP